MRKLALHIASQTSPAYPAQQANGCNGYYNVLHPEMNKIAQVYMPGGIPLIFIEKGKESNSTSKYDFGIIRNDPSDASATAYTEFSHVWADGFGSTSEHGTPMCQVDFLVNERVWFEISKAVLRGCGTLLDPQT
jgi:hypothetical protein